MIECTCQGSPLYVLRDQTAVLAIVQICLYTQTHTCITNAAQNEGCVRKACTCNGVIMLSKTHTQRHIMTVAPSNGRGLCSSDLNGLGLQHHW